MKASKLILVISVLLAQSSFAAGKKISQRELLEKKREALRIQCVESIKDLEDHLDALLKKGKKELAEAESYKLKIEREECFRQGQAIDARINALK